MKNKLTLLIILALLISCVLAFASCGETPQNTDTSTNTNTGTSSETDTNGDVNTDTGTGDVTPDVPTEYIIEEADGFDFDTDTKKVYKNISNATEMIDVSNSFKVTEGATWKLYKDFLGEEEYKLKSMLLSVGENKAYIIVYHPNGENFTRYELVLYRLDMKDYSFTTDNAPYEDGTIEELSSVESPATNPQKVGYDFKGWTVDGEIVSFPYQVSVDTVFEAKFTPIEYQIDYTLNGGESNAENPLKYTIEQGVSLFEPTREYYEFAGWYENAECSGDLVNEISLGAYGNKSFYAKWIPITYNITYELNGGTNNAENPNTYNTEISIELKAPTKAGYTFAGWFIDEDFKDQSNEISLGEGNAKTFYAKWNANENTIVFNANSGSGSMLNMTLATNGTANLTANVFVKDGYTFKGWATSSNGAVAYADEASYTMGTEESYTLYAVWEANKNTLVFNANGGNGSMSNMTISTDSQVELTINAFERAGYTFMGWSTSASGGVDYTDGASYTMGANSTYTLYAVWQVNINGVIFNANGGKGTMSSIELATGVTDTLPKNSFTKDGYTFKGWATTNGGSVAYADGASYTMGTNSTYVLYAVWEANKNTLIFDANGGSGSMSNMTIATDSQGKLTSNAFTSDGYTFVGWATSKDGNVAYTDGATYTMGTNSTYTLYAVWQVNTYDITYVLYGGTNNTNPTTYTVEQEFVFKAPTKTGYTFAGWYSDSTFNNQVTGISLGTTGNKTFYAKWTANENTLVFNANGGSGSMSNMTIATDSSENLTKNSFVKEGYTFIGWATSSNGTVAFEDQASYTMGTNSSNTLYAIWEINVYTITYKNVTKYNSNPTTFTIDDLPIKLKDLGGVLFNYWYKESDFSGAPIAEINTMGDITLYAEIVGTYGLVFSNGIDGNWIIEKYSGSSTDVKIPAHYKGKSVTAIASNAFQDCTSLESIIIPSSVISIGENAFYNCQPLSKVRYSGTIEEWCNISFENAYANPLNYAYGQELYINGKYITTLVIPNTVSKINNYAFYNYKFITSITIEGNVTSIGAFAFYSNSRLTSVTMGDSVTTIGDYAFKDCKSLTSVTIPDSVTSIGNSAFENCESLTSVTIPNSVTSIGDAAFSHCELLKSITIPNNVTSIGSAAFYCCRGLTEINFNAISMKNMRENSNVFTYAGYNEDGIKLTIGKEVTKIPAYLFYCRISSTSTTLACIDNIEFEQGSVCESVGASAFGSCRWNKVYIGTIEEWCNISFENSGSNPLNEGGYLYINGDLVVDLVIPNTVTKINNYAFSGSYSLNSVTLHNLITSIGSGAFYGCSSIESITVPNGVTSIRNYTFRGCTSLTSVIIPNSVKSIGTYAFYDCTSLENITIPERVTSIASNAFSYCKSLRNIVIPNSVTTVGDSAFSNCTSLRSATIGSGVTSIGKSAFASCTSLSSVTFENPNGWQRVYYSSSTSGTTISSSYLSSTSTAAKYLVTTYYDYYWKRT